jgi:hypothetical protein
VHHHITHHHPGDPFSQVDASHHKYNKIIPRVETGHASLADDMFASTGGELMALIAKIGCSAMIDASGAGTFASQVKKDGSALGADLQMSSDSSEAPKKKTKRYEIEFGREKLAAKCREESDEAVKQGLAAVAKAEGTLQVSEDVEGIVTGMSRLRQVLSTRVEYLKQALASSDGQKPSEFTGTDDEELNAIEDILTGVSLVLVGGSYAEEEKQTHLTTLFKSMDLPRAKCVALRHHWNGVGFECAPDLSEVMKDFQVLKNNRTVELNLAAFLAIKAQQNLPAPIEDVTLLLPICSLAFKSLEVETCDNEVDIKALTKNFIESTKTFKALVAAVIAGSSQLVSHIERAQNKDVSDKLKAEQNKKKEQDKLSRLQLAKDDAEKKKQGKAPKAGQNQNLNLTSQEPCIVLTASDDKIQKMNTFANSEAFLEWRQGKVAKDFSELGPYIISEVRYIALG